MAEDDFGSRFSQRDFGLHDEETPLADQGSLARVASFLYPNETFIHAGLIGGVGFNDFATALDRYADRFSSGEQERIRQEFESRREKMRAGEPGPQENLLDRPFGDLYPERTRGEVIDHVLAVAAWAAEERDLRGYDVVSFVNLAREFAGGERSALLTADQRTQLIQFIDKFQGVAQEQMQFARVLASEARKQGVEDGKRTAWENSLEQKTRDNAQVELELAGQPEVVRAQIYVGKLLTAYFTHDRKIPNRKLFHTEVKFLAHYRDRVEGKRLGEPIDTVLDRMLRDVE